MSNQLQHKLAHLEVEPPARLWDAITDALEDQTSAAAGKLQHFEAVPKAQLWEQIESGLDAIPEAQQHKIKAPRRIPQALRYVGAAAILFMVAATVIFLLNEDTA